MCLYHFHYVTLVLRNLVMSSLHTFSLYFSDLSRLEGYFYGAWDLWCYDENLGWGHKFLNIWLHSTFELLNGSWRDCDLENINTWIRIVRNPDDSWCCISWSKISQNAWCWLSKLVIVGWWSFSSRMQIVFTHPVPSFELCYASIHWDKLVATRCVGQLEEFAGASEIRST